MVAIYTTASNQTPRSIMGGLLLQLITLEQKPEAIQESTYVCFKMEFKKVMIKDHYKLVCM